MTEHTDLCISIHVGNALNSRSDQGVLGGTAEDLPGGYGGQKLLVSRS